MAGGRAAKGKWRAVKASVAKCMMKKRDLRPISVKSGQQSMKSEVNPGPHASHTACAVTSSKVLPT